MGELSRMSMIESMLRHLNSILPEEYECVLAQFENPDGSFSDDVAVVRRDGEDLDDEEMAFLNMWTAHASEQQIVTEEGVYVVLSDSYQQKESGFVKHRVTETEVDDG